MSTHGGSLSVSTLRVVCCVCSARPLRAPPLCAARLPVAADGVHITAACVPAQYVYGCDDEESLRKLAAKVKAKGVRYHLWLEQPENEATALAAWPARRSECQKPFKGLSFL